MKETPDELFKDIFAYAVLLLRLGFEDCLETQVLFVEMVNGAGFRTVSGKEFTKQSFYQMVKRLKPTTIPALKEEFSNSFDLINKLYLQTHSAIDRDNYVIA